jgi:hypothetical protein
LAIVGDAYIVVRAVTTGFQQQVNNALRQVNTSQAGQNAGQQFTRGFTRQMSGSSKTFQKFRKDSLAANEAFRKLVTTGYFVGPAISGAVGLIAQLAAGLGAFVMQIGAALPAMAALAGGMSALAQAAATVKLAFGGVGKAISALSKGAKGGGKSAEDALKRIRDAEKRLARTIEDNEETLEQSKRNLIDAEEALTEARNEAAESLQQLNFDAEDAALAEKKAAIELEKARETLARVQDLAPNTRARREAELAFAEADLNLRRARDANADLTKETEAQNAAGVEGSKAVLAATEARDDAAVQLARDERNALRALEDSTEALQEAKKAAKEAGGGVNAVADAMKDLSPEAQRFARYIAGLKPVLLELKAAAGRQLFLPLEQSIDKLVTTLVPPLLPLLEETGGAIGRVATGFADMLTAPDTVRRITDIFKNNVGVIENFGGAFTNITEGVITLLDAAGPLTTRFSEWTKTVTENWKEQLKAKDASGELTENFDYAGDVAADLGASLGNIFGGLKNIVKAATGPGSAGEALLKSFKGATERFEEFTKKANEDGSLEAYFQRQVPVVQETGNLIKEIFKQAFTASNPEDSVAFLKSLQEAVKNIGDAFRGASGGLPALGEFIERFTRLIALFAESGSIKAFFDSLNKGLDFLIRIFSNETVQQITMAVAGFLGMMKALTLMKNVGMGVVNVFAGYLFKLEDIVRKVPAVNRLFYDMKGAFINAGGGLAGLQAGLGALLSPVGLIVIGVGILIGVFVLAYMKSKALRDAIADMGEVLMGNLKQAFDKIMEAIQEVMPGVESFGDVFKEIGDFLAKYFVPILEIVLVGAIELVADRIVGFIKIVAGIIDIFKAVWEFIKGFFFLFTGQTDKAKEHFGKAFESMVSGLSKIFGGVFQIIVSPFKLAFNTVARIWNATVGKMKFTLPSWVPGIGGKTFQIPPIPLWGESDANPNNTLGAPGGARYMAKGGTVYPQTGGTLVRVAEAGRAERIEPLNEAGLSKRDIAMINMMSGGAAGGQTFNIYPAPKMDETELAAIISRQLAFQLRAGSI